MTMRAWRNTLLRFGLVNIPVSLAPARDTKAKAEGHTYDRLTKERVKRAWQLADGSLTEDTFTGFVGSDGEPREVAVELDGEAGIDLQGYCPLGSIDPVWYDDCYALWPAKGGNAGLGLVATILREGDYCLTAQARFTDRPRSVVLRWSQAMQAVVLHTLVYADALRISDVASANGDALTEPTAEMLAQGRMLTAALPSDWQPLASDPLQAAILAQLAGSDASDGDASDTDAEAEALLDAMRVVTAGYDSAKGKREGKASATRGDRQPAKAKAKVKAKA